MAEKNERLLTERESLQFPEIVRQLWMNGVDLRFLVAGLLIAAATPEHCTCDTPRYAPAKIGSAWAQGRIGPETVTAIVGRFAACRGKLKETVVISPEKIDEETGDIIPQREITVDMCHYSSGAANKTDSHLETQTANSNFPLVL